MTTKKKATKKAARKRATKTKSPSGYVPTAEQRKRMNKERPIDSGMPPAKDEKPKAVSLAKIFKHTAKEDHRSRIVTSMDGGFGKLTEHATELALFCKVGKITTNLESRVSALDDVLRVAKAVVLKAKAIGKELADAGVAKLLK
jgi:hypothetical protein